VTWTGLSVDDRGRLRTEITIEQVRRLIRDVGLKPMVGRYKVYVVDPAEAMNQYSANALLKAIEEPPGPVVWVLVASQPSALLPTILSRCQKVGFQLAGTAAVENHLLRLGATEEDAVSLAALSGGRIGWAVSALQRPEVLAARTALLELCAETDRWDSTAGLRLADDIKRVGVGLAEAEGNEGESEDSLGADAAGQSQGQRVSIDRRLRAELPWCLDVMASWYRDRLAARAGGQVLNVDHEAAVRRDLGGSAAGRAEQAVEMIHRAKLDLQHNANVDLALEALAVRLLAAGSR
jgi:DNA polymerase-3 subunit delta'